MGENSIQMLNRAYDIVASGGSGFLAEVEFQGETFIPGEPRKISIQSC